MIKWNRQYYSATYPCSGPVVFEYYPEGNEEAYVGIIGVAEINKDGDSFYVEGFLIRKGKRFASLSEAKDYAEKSITECVEYLNKKTNNPKEA